MKLRSGAPRWFNDDPAKTAKCIYFTADKNYDPWFGTDEDEKNNVEEMEEAKKICAGTDDGRPCPLLEQCLEFALANNERYGVWGATDPKQREQLRRERRHGSSGQGLGTVDWTASGLR